MYKLYELLTRCEEDTRRLLGHPAANRLSHWRDHLDNQQSVVEFVQRAIRGDSRINGWKIDRAGGLSLEKIVITCPDLFDDSDVEEAKRTLGLST